jgi:uncharacterized YigZ family protein
MSGDPYRIPAEEHRIQTEVARSRFITTVAYVPTVDEARAFLQRIRDEMPDASHHVYAFRVGHGPSITEGMSDDGEPSGTAGPPTLAVLRGSDLGDIALVTTRYFGGTRLGTGGLVRAYSEAAHIAINSLKTTAKIEKTLVGLELPYSLFEQAKLLIEAHDGQVEDEEFAAEVTLIVSLPSAQLEAFTAAIQDLSAGKVAPVILDE